MKKHSINNLSLKGKRVLITGGAGFLGIKHAEAILEAKGTVILTDINVKKLREEVKKLSKNYPKRVFGIMLDITNETAVKKAVLKVTKEIGPIDILINNAANNPHVSDETAHLTRFEHFPLEVWDKDFAVGVTGAFLMSKHIGGHMLKNGGGTILNIASDLGIIAPNQNLYKKEGVEEHKQPVKPVSYSVTKHALIGLTKYLATHWPDKNIRVNAVAFGGVYNNQPAEFVRRVSELIPMGRMAHPDEYKSAIVFLCSDASSYMTGATLIIDGGRTAW